MIALVVWLIGFVIMAAVAARSIWTEGTADGITPHNWRFTALGAVVFGIAWPILVALFAFYYVLVVWPAGGNR